MGGGGRGGGYRELNEIDVAVFSGGDGRETYFHSARAHKCGEARSANEGKLTERKKKLERVRGGVVGAPYVQTQSCAWVLSPADIQVPEEGTYHSNFQTLNFIYKKLKSR